MNNKIFNQCALDFIDNNDNNLNEYFDLIITSPPYNIGKEYETKVSIKEYIENQTEFIVKILKTLKKNGSIFWQVGNFIDKGEVYPLDIYFYNIFKENGLKLRNRIIWTFEHGLHCKKRLSGRYETMLWFTKSDDYYFDLDSIRIPQKYKNKKYYKGPKKGQLSCNPLGKNPGDVWRISNVKHNHPEKTEHPCQFPLDLIDKIILSCSKEGDKIFDPFIGSGTTAISCLKNKRIYIGCDTSKYYCDIANDRIDKYLNNN